MINFFCFLIALKFHKEVVHNKGTWALVTASTDGIGLGFAEELAKKGYNIVQISRNLEKMKAVSAQLQSKYKVQTKEIVFSFDKVCTNFNQSYLSLVEMLKEGPDKLNIEFVVNNVGVGCLGFKNNLPKVLEALAINTWPMVLISKVILDNYSSSISKVKMINLSSITAITGYGKRASFVYGSTKSFNLVFTEVLINEGINGLALAPAWVDTTLSKPMGNFRTNIITTTECAQEALSQFGSVSVTCGHYKHWIDGWLYRLKNIRVALLDLS
jgi:17beta-estradiol 17-dehydrogenase / very-long-chain 3-oxoacyl-CoA reductase